MTEDADATTEDKKANWLSRHKIVTAAIIILLIGLIAGAVTYGSRSAYVPAVAGTTGTGDGVAGKFKLDMPADNTSDSKQPKTTVSGGIYEVGVDIMPGKYKTDGGPDCYYARLSSFNTTDIIANALNDGPAVVVISPQDKAFEVRNCTWTLQS